MKMKELQELKNSLVADMKALTENEEMFDKAAFESKEQELKEVQDKIVALEKIEDVSKVDNKVEKVEKDGIENMEFKNKLMNGQEVRVDFKNQMTTTNAKLEKVSNGQAVIEKAQENPILGHLRIERVNGKSIVPVQKSKMGKLVKAAELAEIEKKDTTFETVDLRPLKYSAITIVSEELMETEAYDVEGIIVQEAREAIDNTIAELVIKGDDTCFGLEKVADSQGAKKVVRAGGASTLALGDVNKLYFALESKFRKNAIWVCNDADLQLLMTLTDNQGRPIVHQDLTQEFAFTLYGRPIVVSEDATKMYFADMTQAMVVGAGDNAQIKKSEDAYFATGGIGFRTTTVIDVKQAIGKAVAYLVTE